MENVQEWTDTLSASVVRVAEVFFAYLPSVLGSLALVVIGWLAARAFRSVTRTLAERGLERLARQRLARTKAIDSNVQQSAAYRLVPVVAGALVYWTVLLFFIAAAIEALGLPAVSNVVTLVSAYLPRVLAAALILLVGLWAGEFVRTLLQRVTAVTEIAYAPFLGRALQVLIGVVFLIIAVAQLGIDSSVLVITLAIVFAAAFGSAALAFGLGARATVSNIIAARYVRRGYRPGDTIRIGDIEGQLVEITDTSVLLDSAEGRVTIPAIRFVEDSSLLLKRVTRQ